AEFLLPGLNAPDIPAEDAPGLREEKTVAGADFEDPARSRVYVHPLESFRIVVGLGGEVLVGHDEGQRLLRIDLAHRPAEVGQVPDKFLTHLLRDLHRLLVLIPGYDASPLLVGPAAQQDPARPPVEDVRDGGHGGLYPRALRLS